MNDTLHASLYDGTTIHDLNDYVDPSLSITLQYTNDINNLGQIIGSGKYLDGSMFGFVLTPLPEPSNMIIFSLGMVWLIRKTVKK